MEAVQKKQQWAETSSGSEHRTAAIGCTEEAAIDRMEEVRLSLVDYCKQVVHQDSID